MIWFDMRYDMTWYDYDVHCKHYSKSKYRSFDMCMYVLPAHDFNGSQGAAPPFRDKRLDAATGQETPRGGGTP